MSDHSSLSHTKWECKYHVVFILKCRRKVLYGEIRRNLGEVFHELAKQREEPLHKNWTTDSVVARGTPCQGRFNKPSYLGIWQGQAVRDGTTLRRHHGCV